MQIDGLMACVSSVSYILITLLVVYFGFHS